jgi:hypothetical protein
MTTPDVTASWHEDFSDALVAARATDRPILSLRLLGRLDEEESCANSRFFRTTLYPDARVTALLGARFVLHWRSVRPVPVVTVDFGDGRRMRRPITGNSAHLVLDRRGRPVDALPGLFDAGSFVRLAGAAADLAQVTAPLDGSRRQGELALWHRARRAALVRAWATEVGLPGARTAEELAAASDWKQLAFSRAASALPSDLGEIVRRFPSARDAGAIAATKHAVERPLLEQLDPLASSIAEDTAKNEYLLHRRVHDHFAARAASDQPEPLAEWIYRELFLMPLDDPWLGLRPEAFAALA